MKTKMSRGEAGRLGAVASKNTQQRQKQERINKYNENPTRCSHPKCNSALPYDKRYNKYCNHQCAALHKNNGGRPRQYFIGFCFNCNTQLTNAQKKFCNSKCQRQYDYDQWKKEVEKTGVITGGRAKRYLIETRGHKCELCGGTEWNGQPMPLIKDHIDGNSEDNRIENLRLVCGNCDMQLPTYKSKNRGNGRHSRRKRYSEGKSY